MRHLRFLSCLLAIYIGFCALSKYVKAEAPPHLSDQVARNFAEIRDHGVGKYYPIEQLPMLFKTIYESADESDMFKKINREGSFPFVFMGNDPKLGYVKLFIFNVWVSEEAKMLGQNRVFVQMYYMQPTEFEKRGHIQQPVEVHW